MTAKQSFESDFEFRIYRFVGVKGVEIIKDFFEEKETDQEPKPRKKRFKPQKNKSKFKKK